MTKLHINPFNVKTGIVPKLNELWQLLFFKFYLLRIFLVVFNEERFPDIFWKKKFMPAVCLVLYVWLISFLCHSYVSVVICVLKSCAGTMCPPAPPPWFWNMASMHCWYNMKSCHTWVKNWMQFNFFDIF